MAVTQYVGLDPFKPKIWGGLVFIIHDEFCVMLPNLFQDEFKFKKICNKW